jgi:hypothetical protein
MKNIKTVSNFKRLIDKYDFTLGEGNNNKKGKYVSLEATTIDGGKISWLKYYPEMEIFKFKINNSDGKIFILEVKSTDFLNARQKAYEFCYRTGYCFIGRC